MTNALTGKDICAIISACAKAKVTTFVLGELNISFVPEQVTPDNSWPSYINQPIQKNDDTNASGEVTPQDNSFQKQVTADVLADLALSDPLAFEQFMTGQEKIEDGI